MNNDFLTGKHDTEKGMLPVWCEVSQTQQCVWVWLWKHAHRSGNKWWAEWEREAAKWCVNVTPLHAWLDFFGLMRACRFLHRYIKDSQQIANRRSASRLYPLRGRTKLTTKQLVYLSESRTLIAGLIAAMHNGVLSDLYWLLLEANYAR